MKFGKQGLQKLQSGEGFNPVPARAEVTRTDAHAAYNEKFIVSLEGPDCVQRFLPFCIKELYFLDYKNIFFLKGKEPGQGTMI